ncbi:hypothetical protein B5S28_g1110 [[Candida] boidinii]|uniref:Unnamed protein product n=1 Tax=Candida boidinii TaxID=5477 RepID=A0ACB5TFT5_CANBO|nr:hypothetical protein B5S28_g1110 [[Candida] boidinii]OWB59748.1 hypothetical protein B5S29_g611 [[Candida] boidinii]OWB72037.1 hypothetical protein B5S31_g1738 [[Candida] boidinii]OWB79286.1 hypothetical protein B5S32_g3501 [[Candida] boidinii]GME87632.1 unnamed protein product [[Candida] boidinii]
MDLPFSYDSVSKKISLDDGTSLEEYQDLNLEIKQLNVLVQDVINASADVPPAPSPETYTKKLSMMIKKMHESAVLSMRTGKTLEAIKQFNVALGLASARPKFESFQLGIGEFIICLIGRCDCYLISKNWAGAYADAEILAQLAANVPDNHLRKGLAEMNLGDLSAAKASFERGLCFGATHPKLLAELENVKQKIAVENGED